MAGLFLTGLGVIVGMYFPVVGSPWGSEDDVRKERILRIRYAAGIVLVITGTLMQIYAAWPRLQA